MYLNKLGTILALKPDEKGYPIKRVGQGRQARRVCCTAVLRALCQRGISLDQTVDLEYDEQASAWVARLQAACEPSDKPRPGRPPKV